jgi:hypothetical protein
MPFYKVRIVMKQTFVVILIPPLIVDEYAFVWQQQQKS